jgi:2-amino-4-hydroxy-6-hydroxymethyldihydropteridine diphosphokinase
MSNVVLLLGGNEDKTQKAFSDALDEIENTVGEMLSLSSLYHSPPWGFSHPHWFLNQVVIIKSVLPPEKLLQITQQIEKKLGRKRKTTTHYESRLIDIDILFLDDRIINSGNLQVPHPRLHLRRFTLIPLNELMKEYVHPVLGKSISEILQECSDNSPVERIG